MYYYLQRTKTTPQTLINEGFMSLSGKAFPIGQHSFYNQLNKQVEKYSKRPAKKTFVEMDLSFINASSKRFIVEFFNQLEYLNNKGFKVGVKWWYDKDDEDVMELGEIYKSMFNFDIDLTSK